MSSPDFSPRSVMIVAGGTGGHVYPGLAVAHALKERGIKLYWMGTRQGLEARVVPQHGFPLCLIPVSGLRRTSLLRWLTAPAIVTLAVVKAIIAIVKTNPRVVLGMGGFVSGPGGVAAWLCRRPLVIHEQNAVPGLTNRLLRRLARCVLEAFPGSFPKDAMAVTTGNPIRAEIIGIDAPGDRLASREGVNVLVFGGSRGARALNEQVPFAINASGVRDMRVRHQCGVDEVESTRARYRLGEGITQVEIEAYIDDMAGAYRWADIVIARAGAITIAEIAACGIASILIPYPYAVDDHQTINARYLSDKGAAVLLPEHEMTTESLCTLLVRVLNDRNALIDMAMRARALALPSATQDVAKHCVEFIDA